MAPDDARQLDRILHRSPRSMWGYLGFVLPLLLIVVGLGLNALLLQTLSGDGALELLVRRDGRTTPLWDSELVRRAALTATLMVALTGALLAWLARDCLRQKHLLQRLVADGDLVPPGPGQEAGGPGR